MKITKSNIVELLLIEGLFLSKNHLFQIKFLHSILIKNEMSLSNNSNIYTMNFQEADQSLVASQFVVAEQELSREILAYYKNLRNDYLPSLTTAIPQQFIRIQKEIIGVVELRKNMQKTYQMDALQSQHFSTIVKLLEEKIESQKIITQMAEKIKAIEKINMGDYITKLRQLRQNTKQGENNLFEKGHQILLELSNLRRTFSTKEFINYQSLSQSNYDDLQSLEINLWSEKEQNNFVIEPQQQKWQLTKFIYTVKLKQLALRQELIEERQRVHLEFQRSNTQLIDILLREKERDRNLRQKDFQKFGQIIKQRNEIEIQYENLNHSQKSLLPLIQAELLKLKGKLKEQQSRHDIENQQWQIKCDQLERQLRKAISISSRKEQISKNKQKQSQYELKSKLDKNNELQLLLRELQSKQNEVNLLLQLQRSKSLKLQIQIQQHNQRNQSLQSQLNQMILKSSQLSHIKADISSKLDKSLKKIEQLEKKIQQLNEKNSVEQVRIQGLNIEVSKIKAQIQDKNQQIKHFKEQISHKNAYLERYQQKQEIMERRTQQLQDLHQRLSNQYSIQTKALLVQIQQKNSHIIALQTQIQASKSQKQILTIDSTLYQGLSQQIIIQLKRGQQQKTKIIDDFIKRINFFVVN